MLLFELCIQFKFPLRRRWRSGLERSPRKRKIGCSHARVSRVLGDDHYKWMPHVTVGVAC